MYGIVKFKLSASIILGFPLHFNIFLLFLTRNAQFKNFPMKLHFVLLGVATFVLQAAQVVACVGISQ